MTWPPALRRLWPHSLTGQMLLAVAAALLLAQSIGAMLVYRAQAERRETALVHTAAFRLLSSTRGDLDARGPDSRGPDGRGPDMRPHGQGRRMHAARVEVTSASPLLPGDKQEPGAAEELRRVLADQDFNPAELVVVRRKIANDPPTQRRLDRQRDRQMDRAAMGDRRERRETPKDVIVAAAQLPDSRWLVARVVKPPVDREGAFTLIGQTLLIYLVLVGAIALILRRITRPLAALTERLELFAQKRSLDGQLAPQGPDDVRRLIVAHNAMESRIVAMLDEKDVMLGAIGHDLKTPLAALRVRIESVDDDAERERMAATIEDIVQSLDDILSLARVGRPSDPLERSELSALVYAVIEEFEDMGEPVELASAERMAFPLRATWLRRALRNLIGNAVRYAGGARVTLARESGRDGDWAVIRIDDDGPGIPDDAIADMLEPFKRGDPSRNSETGGAGLGLTLARAIAEQHGGALTLANRRGADGAVEGLTATLRLPMG